MPKSHERGLVETLCLCMLTVCAGCVYSTVSYEPSSRVPPAAAKSAVSRALYALWVDQIEYVSIEPEYVEYGRGVISRSRGTALAAGGVVVGRSSTQSHAVLPRIYFEDIESLRLKERSKLLGATLYVVEVWFRTGAPKQSFCFRRIGTAKQLIDGLGALQRERLTAMAEHGH